MGIENLKRWHWCLIGIAFGCAFAAIKLWAGVEEPKNTATYNPAQFEAMVLGTHDPATGRRVHRLYNFVVHAAQDHPATGQKSVSSEILTFDAELIREPKRGEKPPVLAPGEKPPTLADPFPRQLVMEIQSDRERSLVGSAAEVRKLNVREYLDKLKAKIAAEPKRYEGVTAITYKYNWLESPRGAYAVYGGAGFVIIGLIFPTFISLLSGAGFGRPKAAKEDYDLSRFKGEKEAAANAKPVVTAQDKAQLATLEAELEAKLKAGAKPRVAKPGEAVAAPAAVKVLNAGPAEHVKPAEVKETPRKGFGADQGDYYPTEVHGKKKPQARTMTATEIVDELKALGGEGTKRVLMKHGIAEPLFGVKVGDLKKIQKRVKVNHQLALDLYATNIYDAMYLAGLIADDAKMTPADLRRWAKGSRGGLCAYTVPWVASGGPHARAMAQEWIESKEERIAAIGWATLASFVSITDDADLDLPELKRLLQRVQKTIHDQPNAVRSAMNNFVICLGTYVRPLTDHVTRAAEKIGQVNVDVGDTACEVPFAPNYIQKCIKRGTGDKKRKTAKC